MTYFYKLWLSSPLLSWQWYSTVLNAEFLSPSSPLPFLLPHPPSLALPRFPYPPPSVRPTILSNFQLFEKILKTLLILWIFLSSRIPKGIEYRWKVFSRFSARCHILIKKAIFKIIMFVYKFLTEPLIDYIDPFPGAAWFKMLVTECAGAWFITAADL